MKFVHCIFFAVVFLPIACESSKYIKTPTVGSWTESIFPGNKVSTIATELINIIDSPDRTNLETLSLLNKLQGESKEAAHILYAEILIKFPHLFLNEFIKGDQNAAQMAQAGWRGCSAFEHVKGGPKTSQIHRMLDDYFKIRIATGNADEKSEIAIFCKIMKG